MDKLWPIWKDYFVTLGSGDKIDYIIRAETPTMRTTIYKGTAYARPNTSEIRIRINDICADYLMNAFPHDSEEGAVGNISVPTFSVEVAQDIPDESDFNTVAVVQFINDWSYDAAHNTSDASAPIDGVVDVRQPLIYSSYRDEVEALLKFNDGTTASLILPMKHGADFADDFNDDFATAVGGASAGSAVIKPSEWEGLTEVVIEGHTYKVQSTCQRYALYYTNEYGGWDSFVMQNTSKQSDAYTRHTHSRNYDNSISHNRGVFTYMTEVAPSWSFTTKYLADSEAEKMHHLLGSNDVYLLDMERGEMLPVNISNKSCDYLTVKNNGRAFPTYTINVQLAQTRIRR